MKGEEKLNVEVSGVVINDVAEKIGSIFGDEGRQLGQIIDELTKDITIIIGKGKDNK